jgi:hypothetical protein
VKLADQGTSVAATTQASILEVRDNIEPYVEGQLLLAALTGRPEPSQAMLDSISRISDALTLRAEVMDALSRAYAALSAHPSYDAGADVESAVKDLGGAVSAYAAVISPAVAPVVAGASWALSKASGALVGNRQVKELKAASATIRERLKDFKDALEKERAVHEAIKTEIATNSGLTASALWKVGLADPGSLIKEQIGSLGLVYEERALSAARAIMKTQPGSTAARTREDDFVDAVGKVVKRRAAHRAELQAAIVGDTISSLDRLIAAHAKFERGEPMSLEAIAQQLATIRGKVDALKSERQATSKVD